MQNLSKSTTQVIENIVIPCCAAMPLGGTITVGAHNKTIALNEHPLLPPANIIKIQLQRRVME